MNLTRNPAVITLSIWLLLTGLIPLLNLKFPQAAMVLALLAIGAGALFLFGMSRTRAWQIGPIVLAGWLIVTGLLTLVKFDFPAEATILALAAVAAGVLLLMQR